MKPRDLRSNDKAVLGLKKAFEQQFSQGYLVTKRGEQPPAEKDKRFTLDLSDLGKYLISWHSQRPNIAYSENKIFDKYFDQLFRRPESYRPADAQALNTWMQEILSGWVADNPFGLNESLLAMKAYAPFHQLYAVSMCFATQSNQSEKAPQPNVALERTQAKGVKDQIVQIAATCVNTALEAAANEPQPKNRVFSPQNWIKTKTCLSGINAAIRQYFSMLPGMPGGKEASKILKETLALSANEFEDRWAAD